MRDAAFDALRLVAEIVLQRFGQPDHLQRIGSYALARSGGDDAARMTVEEAIAKPGLQVADALARRGDREVGDQGARTDAPGLHHREEEAQRGEVHL